MIKCKNIYGYGSNLDNSQAIKQNVPKGGNG